MKPITQSAQCTNNPAAKDWMTVKDLADYLSLSPSTIYKKLQSKEIPHYKPSNGMVWFRLSDIDAWLEAGKVVNQNNSLTSNTLNP